MYAYLSYFGFNRGKQVMDGFWTEADETLSNLDWFELRERGR